MEIYVFLFSTTFLSKNEFPEFSGSSYGPNEFIDIIKKFLIK